VVHGSFGQDLIAEIEALETNPRIAAVAVGQTAALAGGLPR